MKKFIKTRIVVLAVATTLVCGISVGGQRALRGGGTFHQVGGNVKADGTNLPGALVFLMIDGNITESTTTDENGEFSLNALEGVTYSAGVFKHGYNFDPAHQPVGVVHEEVFVNFQNGVKLCDPASNSPGLADVCGDSAPTSASQISNGRIAYEVFGSAFAVDPNGTNQSQLPPGGAFPSWSYDGARVLYTRDPSTDVGFDQEIFVMNADGSSFTQLTANDWNDYRARFSPDGSKIVFDRVVNSGDRGIYAIDSDGANETRLTPVDVQVEDASYSPDGSRIVYTDGFQIYVMNADGSSPMQMTFTGPGISNMDPSWSPDGLHIVFITNRGGNGNEIWRMTALGTEAIPLTADEFDKRKPVYSPDGVMIAFSRQETVGDFAEIFTKPVSGGSQQQITTTPALANAENPSWQRVTEPSTVTLGNVSIAFSNATSGGSTVATPIANRSAGLLPGGFTAFGDTAFDIRTSAAFLGTVEVCMSFPEVATESLFDQILVFHNENGQLIDRTSGRDFSTRKVCATVESLSPFIAAIPVSPTSASGILSGRVSDANGISVGNALVRLTLSNGSIRSTRTNQFGIFYYREVELGQSATVEVFAKEHRFDPQVVSLTDAATHLEISERY